MPRIVAAGRAGLVSVVVAAIAACGASSDSPPPLLTGEPPTDRIPVIIDADMDLSDIAAIAMMLRDPALDVRAITIEGTGSVHCQAGRLLTRYLLDELGSPDIPFGCGREEGGADAHPFADESRARGDDAFGFDITPPVESGVPLEAVGLIRDAVDASPSAPTIVALGPLTNLEDAFAADPTLPDRIATVHAQLGTLDAPGNVVAEGVEDGAPLEWNAYADPSAVKAVFETDVPISIVPLDATDDVPVPVDLAERLATDRAAAPADLVYESLIRNPGRLRPDQGQQLWDELAGLSLTQPDLVSWDETSVIVGDDGRITRDEAGRPVRYAAAADQAGVEAGLLAGLRRGEPRATAFEIAGRLSATFDGATCALSGTSDGPGPHELRYEGMSGVSSAVLLAGAQPPQDWVDVLAAVPALDADTVPPDWLLLGPVATDETGSGQPVFGLGDLDDGTYGPVCTTGTQPDVTFTPGAPFETGSGRIGR
jgi:inosine-uridine nucleoside N-ribohydrolase